MRITVRSILSAALAGALVVACVSASVQPAAAAETPTVFSTPGTYSYTVPNSAGSVRITAWGAQGSVAARSSGIPGTGGGIDSYITAAPGDVLQIQVGSQSGGGTGGNGFWAGGAGGGASDVRAGTCAASSSCDLSARVVVAGGGGGTGSFEGNYRDFTAACGGNGGANADGSGADGCEYSGSAQGMYSNPFAMGKGATATGGGAAGFSQNYYGSTAGTAGGAGFGGNGGTTSSTDSGSGGGGGGAGYFGGGGGMLGNAEDNGGGGGGSSWATPSAQSTAFLGSGHTGAGSVSITPIAGVYLATLALTSSDDSQAAGQPVTLETTLSSYASGGTVTFTSNTVNIVGCVDLPVREGVARCGDTTTFRTVGTYTLGARFSGNGVNPATTAATRQLSIFTGGSTTDLSSDVSTTTAGAPVTLRATVSPPPVGGTVAFTSNLASIAGCAAIVPDQASGVATCVTSFTSVRGFSIVASFGGTVDYYSSASDAFTIGVSATATTIAVTSDGSPSGIGRTVTYTATVVPHPTVGTVDFRYAGSPVADCLAVAVNAASGTATCRITYPFSGEYRMGASYTGRGAYQSSSSADFFQTSGATSTIASSLNPAADGRGSTFTTTVTPAPVGGTISLFDDGTPIDACTKSPVDPNTGIAVCTASLLGAHSRSVSAQYYDVADHARGFGGSMTQVTTADGATFDAGGTYSFVVPTGWNTVRIAAWGAAGGTTVPANIGGTGGGATGLVTVSPLQALQVNVGATGGAGAGLGGGGFWGGGDGGGASSVASGACATTLACTTTTALVLGAGGGGAGSFDGDYRDYTAACGGNGGTNADGSGADGCVYNGASQGMYSSPYAMGKGATATAGGAAGYSQNYYGSIAGAAGGSGYGGNGGSSSSTSSGSGGGGGGGGYFGGGGGLLGASEDNGGGGGGSSYLAPTVVDGAFLGAGHGGTGTVSITHAATRATVAVSGSGDIGAGDTRVITATLVDGGGTVVTTGPDSTQNITFTQTGAGTVGGLTAVAAVAGVATITVTGTGVGALSVGVSGNGLQSTPLSLAVAKKTQTIDFAQPTGPLAFGSTFAVAPTASTGLTVLVTATGGCTVSGAAVTITSGAVPCTLTASQPGDSQTEAAATVIRTVSVQKASQQLTFAQPATPAVFGSTFVVAATSTSGLTPTVAVTGGCSIDGATVTMTSGTAACVVTASSAGNGDVLAADDVVRTVAAALSPQRALELAAAVSLDYGDSTTVTVSGGSGIGALALTVTGECETVTSEPGSVEVRATSGDGDCTVTATKAGTTDYSPASVAATIALAPRTLTVDAAAQSKVYGDTTAAPTATLAGFAFDETASIATGAADCLVTAGENAGYHAIACTPGTLQAPNYRFVAGATAQLTITPAALTVTASSSTTDYGTGHEPVTPSYAGLANGDLAPIAAAECASEQTAASPVGSYPTSCSGAADLNYDIAYTSGAVTVVPVRLTVTASDASSVYGSTPPVITAAYSGFVNLDDERVLDTAAVCDSNTDAASHVGSYTSRCASAAASNYTMSYVTGEVEVTPATLSVDAVPAEKFVGEGDPLLAATLGGFRLYDTAALVKGTADCSREAGETVGSYATTCSAGSLSARDYVFEAGASAEFTVSLLPLTGDLSVGQVVAGGTLTATGEGFEPGETVQVWLHSEPVLLATATATSRGTVSVSVTIPALLTPGAHTVELVGLGSGVSVSTALTVTAVPAVALASTGVQTGWTVGLSAMLLALGALLAARRRRKARD